MSLLLITNTTTSTSIISSSTLSMINLNLNQLFPLHSILTDESDEVKII